uniref:ST56 protein n=1 Tax=Escherichia coli TaxID=562 RepID=Q8VNR0_ECOLX|nr:ST56 protein [Escherichia coli]
MKPVQIGFHLCDTAGDFFGTTAEVHPAEFIQLRLQNGLFRAPGCSAFPAGRGSALPVRPGAVSAGRCRQCQRRKVALPQPGWRFSCQWTHYPLPE